MDDRLRQLMHLAREHYEAREYDKAEPLLEQIVREHRGFADMFNMLGVIHHAKGRFPQAEAAFKEALKLNPRYTETALNLAVTLNDLGRYVEAREVYSRAIETSRAEPRYLDPFAKGKIANMHAATGDAYVGLGMLDDATREYRRALELCPTFVDIRNKLGSTLRDKGDKEGALTEYEAVKAQAPKYIPSRVNLGVTLFSLGRKDEARREWESVIADDPTNKSAKMYLEISKG
jgi:tetratricopeptide (TPR) repeat protein